MKLMRLKSSLTSNFATKKHWDYGLSIVPMPKIPKNPIMSVKKGE